MDEVQLREQAGENPDIEEYAQRFPDQAIKLRRQFALHRMLDTSFSVHSPALKESSDTDSFGPQANRREGCGTGPAHRGRLRHPFRAGPRRHGGRLQGQAIEAGPAGGAQDDPGRGPCRLGRSDAVPHRGRSGGQHSAPEHRANLRGRRTGRLALLLAGIRRGRQPFGQAGRRQDASARRGGPDDSKPWPVPSTPPTRRASSTAT